MTKVVSLKGDPINDKRKPRPDVIERLEWLLEAAKSGEIDGVSCTIHFFDDTTGTIRSGVQSYSMVGRMHALILDTIAELKD